MKKTTIIPSFLTLAILLAGGSAFAQDAPSSIDAPGAAHEPAPLPSIPDSANAVPMVKEWAIICNKSGKICWRKLIYKGKIK